MEYRPLDGRQFPRFSGIKTFFRLPHVEINADYDVGIVGVPFDGGVSYRPGARFAPSRIRESSSLGRGFNWGRGLNFIEKIKVADIGDCPTVPISQEKTYKQIEKFFGDLLKKDKKFISVGGDHSTTLPILRALHKKYGKLSLIHFDAHLDTYPAAWGCEYHHGTFARHAVEEGLIDPKKSTAIGIRGPLAGAGDLDFPKKHKTQVVTIDDIRKPGLEKFLSTFKVDTGLPTYISFDIDSLDPAFAPGTGTPVVGGLTTYEVQRILRHLKLPKLVGCDIVEVSPPYDQSEITTLAATDVMFEMLCLFAQNR
ncbi:MAG: agmatinase [Bdellovibrionales bacterium]